MFMKGTVGSWLQGNHIGSMLLVSHFGGAVISALLIWFLFSNDKYAKGITPENDSCAFVSDPISQSIDAVFRVGGCIVFFSVLAGLIKQIPVVTPLSFALIYALLEVSGGMHAISALNLPTSCRAVLIAGFSGFSGLSILFQNFVFLAPLGVRMHTLFLLGLLRACASACIMTLLCVLTG